MQKTRDFQKNIYLCFISCAKAFDCAHHDNLYKILTEMRISGHLTCLMRNLYACQKATVRTLCGTTYWFKIEKKEWQCCQQSPCLFNLYADHIIRNAGQDEILARIKKGGRNINNFRYADDTTLMAENKEELKNLLMKVKELAQD